MPSVRSMPPSTELRTTRRSGRTAATAARARRGTRRRRRAGRRVGLPVQASMRGSSSGPPQIAMTAGAHPGADAHDLAHEAAHKAQHRRNEQDGQDDGRRRSSRCACPTCAGGYIARGAPDASLSWCRIVLACRRIGRPGRRDGRFPAARGRPGRTAGGCRGRPGGAGRRRSKPSFCASFSRASACATWRTSPDRPTSPKNTMPGSVGRSVAAEARAAATARSAAGSVMRRPPATLR